MDWGGLASYLRSWIAVWSCGGVEASLEVARRRGLVAFSRLQLSDPEEHIFGVWSPRGESVLIKFNCIRRTVTLLGE